MSLRAEGSEALLQRPHTRPLRRVVSAKWWGVWAYLGGPEGSRVQHRTLRKLGNRFPRKLKRVSNLLPKLEDMSPRTSGAFRDFSDHGLFARHRRGELRFRSVWLSARGLRVVDTDLGGPEGAKE
jgi:hypothetical protein